MTEHEALIAALRQRVVADTDPDLAGAVDRHVRESAPLLSVAERRKLTARVLAEVQGLGSLEALLGDPTVDEVMVNAGREVWVDRAGRTEQVARLEPGQAEALVERIVTPLGRRLDRSSPVVDARLPDGSRVAAVAPPLAVDGLCLTIRRFRVRAVALSEFASPPVVELMRGLVAQRANVLVSGATSAGKTTLLNALAGCLPSGERIITIEDAAELSLAARHVLRLEARAATADVGAVDVRDLVRAALRLRPDRLVIGEVRGDEAMDLVQALNTGHDGSLATCHANSPTDALRRMELLALRGSPGIHAGVLREQLHAALDAVIHVARRIGGARRVVEVAEVLTDPTGERTTPLAVGDEVCGSFSGSRSW